MQNLVDTKLLAKPPKYSNNRADWPLFKFMVRTYVGAVSEEISEAMNTAEAQEQPIAMVNLNAPMKAHSRTLMYILVSCLQGSALQMAMNTEASNGLEAWRSLVKREEPTEGSTQVAMLMTILRTSFSGGLGNLTEELERLIGMIQRYEQQFNDVISDTIIQAIIKYNTPEELRSQVTMSSYLTAKDLREALVSYAATRAAEAPQPSLNDQPSPMEVGNIDYKGKGKGKKGKGKTKNKGKSKKGDQKGKEGKYDKEKPKFDGYCNNCHKWGHRKSDCWNKEVAAVDQQQQGAPQEQAQQQRPVAKAPGVAAIIDARSDPNGKDEGWVF